MLKKILFLSNFLYNSTENIPTILKQKWPLKDYLPINEKKYYNISQKKIGNYNTPLIILDNLPEILKIDKFNYEKEHKFFKSVVYEYNLVNDSILNGLLRLSGFYLISYIIYYVAKLLWFISF
jgi:hypothetical protein